MEESLWHTHFWLFNRQNYLLFDNENNNQFQPNIKLQGTYTLCSHTNILIKLLTYVRLTITIRSHGPTVKWHPATVIPFIKGLIYYTSLVGQSSKLQIIHSKEFIHFKSSLLEQLENYIKSCTKHLKEGTSNSFKPCFHFFFDRKSSSYQMVHPTLVFALFHVIKHPSYNVF